jgi:hypothetical protein
MACNRDIFTFYLLYEYGIRYQMINCDVLVILGRLEKSSCDMLHGRSLDGLR